MATAIIDLSTLDSSNGFTINGVNPYDTAGYSVSDAGDVNGDGFADLIIGAPGFTLSDDNLTTTPGTAYVVFGNPGGFPEDVNLSELDGTNGFAINGIASDDLSGFSVSSTFALARN